MTVALTQNFLTNARGITFEDSASVTWSFNSNTNELTAAASGGGGGGVSSVGLEDGSTTPIYSISGSPVTSSGTLEFTLETQSANKVFAGPSSGSAAQPTFRALVAADIPSLSYVTSVGLEDGSTTAIYSISGSPVTASGTLEFTLKTQSANLIFAGPSSGSAEQPTFRSLVLADLPAISLEELSDVSASPAQGDVLYYNGTDWVVLTPGTSGQFFETKGTGANPVWGSPSGSGTVTSVGLSDGSTTPIYSINGSPVTGTGTLTFTLETQSKNLVFAGPSSGSAAQPTFRALVAADIPLTSANPSASVGLSAVDGSTGNWMDAGSAPALSQAIAPTWTGGHTWTPGASTIAIQVSGASGEFCAEFTGNSGTGDSRGIAVVAGTNSTDYAIVVANQANNADFLEIFGDGHGSLGSSTTTGMQWTSAGAVTIQTLTVATALTSSTATTLTTGVKIAAAAADTMAFYGVSPISQLATSSNQQSSHVSSSTAYNSSYYSSLCAVVQELVNAMYSYGLYGTH